jgi:hypothetical protein
MGLVLWSARSMNWPLQAVMSLIVYLLALVLFGDIKLRSLYRETLQK